MNSQEWKEIIAGVVMALISGGTWPTFAILLGEVLKVQLCFNIVYNLVRSYTGTDRQTDRQTGGRQRDDR